MAKTIFRTCPLCEATCGLELTLGEGDTVLDVRGDPLDVHSRGYLCAKGASLGQVEGDPDRLTTPLVRRDGRLVPTDWDTAFATVDALISPIISRHGRDSVALYQGNPTGHNVAYPLLMGRVIGALGSRQIYSPATMDQMPQQVVSALLFGAVGSIPVPDLGRTDLLVVVGGNPLVSNGSVGSAPDYRGRLRALRQRGGRLIVVDPVRTATAGVADRHVRPVPGTDAALLLAMVHVLFRDGLVRLGLADGQVCGLAEVAGVADRFAPGRVASFCGVPAEEIESLAHELAGARTAAVYGRLGTTLNQFGTLSSWAIQLLTILTGNLDSPGGMMFTTPAAGSPTTRPPGRNVERIRFGRYHTRVRRAPEVLGEFPVACLAEEILTPGEGRVRGLVTFAGNIARSFPGSASVERGLAALDALVCVDPYLNETTRHADVILPTPGQLTREHFDMVLYQYALHNVANYSPPVLPRPAGMPAEWEVLLRLAGIFAGHGPSTDVAAADEEIARSIARRAAAAQALPVDEVLAELTGSGPARLIDIRLRTGPYGDLYGRRPGGLSLRRLLDHPHGIDLGPLRSRLAEAVRTPSGTVELAHDVLVEDATRLERAVEAAGDQPNTSRLLLVGRRDPRSKNSWLHNIPALAKGRPRCTLQLHPDDAAARGVGDGDDVLLRTAAGTLRAPVEVTDAVPGGTCSLPHGWGHDDPASRLRVARQRPGVNSNVLSDDTVLDPISGTVALNAIPVEVSAARGHAAALGFPTMKSDPTAKTDASGTGGPVSRPRSAASGT